jgi:ATP/maltotriose-dependent transcriptional regulator MalT/anti-sigma regulatory factor (Ser/Thr protein kinase)
MYKIIFIGLFMLCANIFLPAQTNCNCAEYVALQKTEAGDSIIASRLLQSAFDACIAKGNQLMGLIYTNINKLDSVEYFLQMAEKKYKQNNCSDISLLQTYKTWAKLYYMKGDFAKAQEYSLKVLQFAEAANNIYEQANSLTMISQLLNQVGQADKGIVYARKAIPLVNKLSDTNQRLEIIFKISKRYLWHFQDIKTPSSLDSSALFSIEQITLARRDNNRASMAKAFNNLQGVEWEKGNLVKALQYLDSSFAFTDKGNYADLRINYFDKSDILLALKNYPEAARFADSALHYAKLSGYDAYTAESYELSSRIAKESGDYKKAFELNEMARGITDSIRNVEKTEAVAELEKKYNQAKNENTIKDLDKKKQLYLFLAVAGLLAALAIGFFLRQQSLKNKKNILEIEQRLNRARMNPHFFFNALTTLQKFALRENDGQAMASNLSKFSNIMRETLESTYKEYVTIEQEMEFLNEYLEVQKIRFPQTFSYEVNADKNLDIDVLQIPAMIIQPFVENSIEHGFIGVEHPGKVTVNFTSENKELLIEIKDNGKGLTTIVKENNEHISRASQIIKDRIYLLNIKLKTKADFSIDNNKEGKGVTVKINLPVIYNNENTAG